MEPSKAARSSTWDGYARLPSQRPNEYELSSLSTSRAAVMVDLGAHLADSSDVRLEPRRANNLEIYLKKTSFESVPYPDRDEFVTTTGKAWCDNTGEASHIFLPSVKIRDIRTGEELASYSCVHLSDLLK